MGYKNYFIGTNVFTNNPKDTDPTLGFDDTDNGSKIWNNKNGTYVHGIKESSPLYIGRKNGNKVTRIGLNDPLFGDIAQNEAHQIVGSPNFHQGNYGTNAYFQRGTYIPFMLY